MTLPATTIDRIRYLLANGLPQREIERRLAGYASRGSIQNVARGLHKFARDPNPQTPTTEPRPAVAICPGCFYRVELPCRICAARAYRDRHNRPKRRYRRQNKKP